MDKKVEEEFIKYTKKFDLNEKNTFGKLTHSFRVQHQAKKIAESLDLSEEDIKLASTIGLLHDIGRFYQFEKFQSFDDSKTMDHADYGYKYLIEEGNIKKYTDDRKNDKIIGLAIRNHNKYQIEKGLSEKEELFCNIIRDADKIDILYRLAVLKDIEMERATNRISKEVEEDLNNEQTVLAKHCKTKADKLLAKLALVYDINFKYSYDNLEKNDIIENLYSAAQTPHFLAEYFIKADDFVRGRSNKNVR